MGVDKEPVVAGGSVTTRLRSLRRAADRLDPAQALDTIDLAAGRLTTSIPIASVLLGGFGLVSATNLAEVGPGWALPCIAAAALSTVTAVWATMPSADRLRPGDLSALERWFDNQINRRMCLLKTSAIAFAMAIVAATIPTLVAALTNPDPTVELALAVGQPSGKPAAVFRVHNARSGTSARLVLKAQGRRVGAAVVDIPENGELRYALRGSAARGRVTLTAVLQQNGRSVLTRSRAAQ